MKASGIFLWLALASKLACSEWVLSTAQENCNTVCTNNGGAACSSVPVRNQAQADFVMAKIGLTCASYDSSIRTSVPRITLSNNRCWYGSKTPACSTNSWQADNRVCCCGEPSTCPVEITTTKTTTTKTTSTTSKTKTTSTTSRTSTSTTVTTTTITSTTTTTSSSTSSTTTVTPPFIRSVEELTAYYGEIEAAALDDFWKANATGAVTFDRSDVSMTISALADDGNEATVAVAGTDANVTVPASLAAGSDGPVAAVMTVYKGPLLERVNGVDASGYEALVQSTMKMELHTSSGKQKVSGSKEPIVLSMPAVNTSLGPIACAYWDAAAKRYSFSGVTTKIVDGVVQCATTHLSFFAAILRGILTALACSQLTLFNSAAMERLIDIKWLGSSVGAAYMFVVGVLMLMMFAACQTDRDGKNAWKDSHFLVPSGVSASSNSLPVTAASEPESFAVAQSWVKTTTSGSFSAKKCCTSCYESSVVALQEACTEIASNIFEYFGALREFCGHCSEALHHHSEFKVVVQHMMASLTLNSLRKQVSADTGISDEAVDFVMGDEELLKLLTAAGQKAELEGKSACESIQAWYELHKTVATALDNTWQRVGTFRSFHVSIWRVFCLMNPLLSVYNMNPFWSSSQRMLILTCEISGSLLLGVMLFNASAAPMGPDSPESCELDDFWEQVGQMIVIGLFSAIFAALPAAVLSTLHSRKIVRCDYVGCPSYEKRLRIWRTKDRLLWFFGLLYSTFSLFVVALFLANIHPDDQPEWGVSGLTSLVEDFLAMPLAIALFVPLLAVGIVACAARILGARRLELLRTRRVDLEKDGNWQLLPSVSARERTCKVSV